MFNHEQLYQCRVCRFDENKTWHVSTCVHMFQPEDEPNEKMAKTDAKPAEEKYWQREPPKMQEFDKAGTGPIRTPMRQLTMAREKQHRGRMKTARGRVETQIGPLGRVGAAGNGPRRKTETLNLRLPHPLVHMATPPLRPQSL